MGCPTCSCVLYQEYGPCLGSEALAVLKVVEWTGESHDRDNCWPACPACGAPSPQVDFAEANGDAQPGIHMGDCALAAVLIKAASNG